MQAGVVQIKAATQVLQGPEWRQHEPSGRSGHARWVGFQDLHVHRACAGLIVIGLLREEARAQRRRLRPARAVARAGINSSEPPAAHERQLARTLNARQLQRVIARNHRHPQQQH